MKALLIAAFIVVPLLFAWRLIPYLRRSFRDYKADPWTPKPWEDDE